MNTHSQMPIYPSLAYDAAPAQQFPTQQLPAQPVVPSPATPVKQKARSKRANPSVDSSKRRCVSTACVACRKRKSKCDGNTPACAACSSVYGTECVYDPNSDHRRKGVYRQDIDHLKDRTSTLQILVEAILNAPQDDVTGIVQQIRAADSLDLLASKLQSQQDAGGKLDASDEDSPEPDDGTGDPIASFESQLSNKLGQLRVDAGSTRFFGGTSNLVYFGETVNDEDGAATGANEMHDQSSNPVASWTTVTSDSELIKHLLNMYFTWHYSFFTSLSKTAFYSHFMLGKPQAGLKRKVDYCTPLLVNAMLALGCHFTAHTGAYENAEDKSTAGDHFFREAKRLIAEEEEYEHPKLATVQALALMSVREAGCGREAKGWAYSGIAFRMACDLGLNLDSGGIASHASSLDEKEEDARRMTFWGCFLFDKCWSNYLGRLPHFQSGVNITCQKFDVFPDEDAAHWTPYTDHGFRTEHSQPSRVRTVARHLMDLCDISSDLMKYFYHPQEIRSPPSKQAEIKRLGEIHTRLETWRKELPSEFDTKDSALPSVLVMHMFFHLLYIHLFRPFLKYAPRTSPLPSNVSPRRQCTHGATSISKLLRLYKKSYGLRQICNIVVYIAHSACTIHLLNLPDKNARRDIIHGVKELEEIAESWPCARRTLVVLSMQSRKWSIDLPDDAAAVLQRFDHEAGFDISASPSPRAPRPAASEPNQASQKDSTSPVEVQNPVPGSNEYVRIEQHQFMQDFNERLASMTQQGVPFGFAPLTSDTLPSGATTASGASAATTNAFPSPTSATMSLPQDQAVPLSWPQAPVPFARSGAQPVQNDTDMAYASQIPQQQVMNSAQEGQIQSTAMQPPPRPRPQQQQQQQRILPVQHAKSRTPGHARASDVPREKSHLQASRRASATDSMFGGVRALLSESQDFWLRDQSKIASGFGNWHGNAAPDAVSGLVAEPPVYTARAGMQRGPSPESNTASVASASINLDRQCGVVNKHGLRCPLILNCEYHAVHAKRQVQGRSRPFDALLGAEMAAKWELEHGPGSNDAATTIGEADAEEWCG